MRRFALLVALLVIVAAAPLRRAPTGIRIGSKKFTESVVLGEMLTQLLQAQQVTASHLAELGGTRLVFEALVQGEIDLYPEYTGTIRHEILPAARLATADALADALARQGIAISAPLGFNNTYAVAVRRDTAERLQLAKLSDLARHPELRIGFGNEFLERGDGWSQLRKHYGLPHRQVRGMDHDIAYKQLEAGLIDVMDVYSTDAKIAALDLVVLEDDRSYFPRYDAVILSRLDLQQRASIAAQALARLAGKITTPQMRALNARADAEGISERQIAADFLSQTFQIEGQVTDPTLSENLRDRTWEHLDLVRRSLIPAILAAVPLGIAAAKFPLLGHAILGLVGVIQTIPALALLVLMIPLAGWLELPALGAGSVTAIAALFLYSLLPIVRNTAAGLNGIAPEYQLSAAALGLAPVYRLLHIELPLAGPAILAGVKTAAVLNVGFATLGALIGAGGYGQPILTGIRLNDTGLILQGAIPAAVLAVVFQGMFELAERCLVPRGLRLPRHP